MLLIAIVMALALSLSACAGPNGPAGPAGPPGPPGPEGPQGPEGAQVAPAAVSPAIAAAPEYVGDQVCAGCHPDIYKNYIKSGHPWIMNKVVEGKPPAYPFSKLGNPPNGYTWNDIRYVIGGYNWKALFVDKQGYIITDAPGKTGDSNYQNQWNLANELIDKAAGWVGYKSGQEKLLVTCSECHTTGYNSSSAQEGMPGLVGTWAQDGVRCEACHAPGSQHITDPQNIKMPIVRTPDLCAKCHSNADIKTVDDVDMSGFAHPLAETVYRGKHMVLNCVDCHDPHSGVVQARVAGNATTRTACAECHFKEAKYQNNTTHVKINLACSECHMPRIVQAAWGDPAKFTGDIHSHQIAIDPTRFDQLVTVGQSQTYVIAPTGLNYACRHCHGAGSALPKTDDEIRAAATGYHKQP